MKEKRDNVFKICTKYKLLGRSTHSLTQIHFSSIKSETAPLSVVLFFENLIVEPAKLILRRREKICKLYFFASVEIQKRGCSYV